MATRTKVLVLLGVAVMVLAVLAGVLVSTADSPSASPAERATSRRSDAATTTTTTPGFGAPLPVRPRPKRVIWAGDSVAALLAPAVAANGATRGVQVVDQTLFGCGLLRGFPADDQFILFDLVIECDGKIVPRRTEIAAQRGDVVTWLSTWEAGNRVVDGKQLVYGTPEGDALMLELIDESARILTSTGARLVFLTMVPNTTGPLRERVTDLETQRALHLDDLLKQYAAAHPKRTSVLDLIPIACPGGPPCPTVVDGVTLRPNDGGHFEGDGPAWLAPRILDALVGP